jgi:hypothetical protein
MHLIFFLSQEIFKTIFLIHIPTFLTLLYKVRNNLLQAYATKMGSKSFLQYIDVNKGDEYFGHDQVISIFHEIRSYDKPPRVKVVKCLLSFIR